MDKSITDPKFTNIAPDAIQTLVKTCLLPDADGKVSQFIDDPDRFNQLIDVTGRFSDAYTKYNPRDGKSPDSESLEQLRLNTYYKMRDFDVSAFTQTANSANDPIALIDAINNESGAGSIRACATDVLAPVSGKCPSTYTTAQISTAASLDTDRYGTTAAETFCVDLNTWARALNVGGRYGTANNNCVTNGSFDHENKAESLRTCVQDMGTKFDQFINNLYWRPNADQSNAGLINTSGTLGAFASNPGSASATDIPNYAAYNFYTAMNSIKTNFNQVQADLKNVSDVLNSTVEGVDSFLNCKIMRTEMLNMFGNTCYQFGNLSPIINSSIISFKDVCRTSISTIIIISYISTMVFFGSP